MFAQLRGQVIDIEADQCVLDVHGVGYQVRVSRRTLDTLPEVGSEEPIRLIIETIVREDAITLYGFADTQERLWFRLLTTVQGVGPNLALNILSGIPPEELVQAIGQGDQRRLIRLPGVGAKLAIRLITELQEKAPRLAAAGTVRRAPRQAGPVLTSSPAALALTVAADAISALQHLGYRPVEAEQAVEAALAAHPDATMDTLIRMALVGKKA